MNHHRKKTKTETKKKENEVMEKKRKKKRNQKKKRDMVRNVGMEVENVIEKRGGVRGKKDIIKEEEVEGVRVRVALVGRVMMRV